MAIGTTNISMGNIFGEVNDTLPGGTNVSLKTQSENAANTTHTSTISGYTSPGGGLTGAPYGMGEFGGYINISYDAWPTDELGATFPYLQWGTENHYGTNYIQVGCNYSQFHDKNNDRLVHRSTSFDSTAASVYSYAYQDYTGLDNATFQAKADYNTTLDAGLTNAATYSENPASYSPASGTWTNVSSSGYSPTWQWTIELFTGNFGTATITSSYSNPKGVVFYSRANLSGTYYPNSSGYNNQTDNEFPLVDASVNLQLTRGTTPQPQGPA